MIIAQLTDLHIVAPGQLCQNRIPTAERLRRAVSHINNLRLRPEVVLISGDLAENGWSEEYGLVRAILKELIPPYFIVPGNHDRRANLLEAFADHPYLPDAGSAHVLFAVEDFPLRLIGVDTSLRGEPYGRFCEERLNWLEKKLAERCAVPTLLFMHHCPVPTGIRWIDAAGLYGASALESILLKNRQVKGVLCGHVHRSVQAAWGGTLVSAAPSSSHAQLALCLDEKSGFDFTYSDEPAAVAIYRWDEGQGLVSHLSYVQDVPLEYQPEGAESLKSRFLGMYADICAQEYGPKRS